MSQPCSAQSHSGVSCQAISIPNATNYVPLISGGMQTGTDVDQRQKRECRSKLASKRKLSISEKLSTEH
jgi:uncharacterized protein YfiM (DUF2279 family)